MQKAIVATMTLPPAVMVAAWLSMLAVSGVAGRHPIWSMAPENVAEAAAARDAVAVIRLVAEGANINRPGQVRAGLLLPHEATLTPFEAAAAAQDEAMVEMLLNLGASPDTAAWQRAWCLSDAPAVRETLATRGPAGLGATNCR